MSVAVSKETVEAKALWTRFWNPRYKQYHVGGKIVHGWYWQKNRG